MSSSVPSRRFYVYVLCRPGDPPTPFYVGKGTGDRIDRHEQEARRGFRSKKCSIIRKIWKQGNKVQRYIMLETDDEREAFAYEVALIALYGSETLANQTAGGEGGRTLAPIVRMKISQTIRKALASPEARAEVSNRIRRALESPQLREQRRQHFQSLWDDPEHRAKMAEIHNDPEYLARQSAIQRTIKSDPAERARASAISKTLMEDPEHRAKVMANLEQMNSPEAIAANIERTKKSWADPVLREQRLSRMSEAQKRRWADPEQRAKMTAINKANGAKRKAIKGEFGT